MTATGDVLNQVVPTLVRVARRPGAVLLQLAAASVGVFALLGAVFVTTSDGWGSWVPLVLSIVLAAPVVVLAVRRERLQARTAELEAHRTISGEQGTVVVAGAAGARNPMQEELDSISAAMAENGLRTARFLPRIEAAQRAGLLAAGGPVNAPYLRDDLRITIVALIATIAAIPLGAFGSIVTAILLLG